MAAPPLTSGRPTLRGLVKRRGPIAPYLLLIPAVVMLAVALGYPMVWQFVTSFKEYGRAQMLGNAPAKWIGLDNYTAALSDGYFWEVVARSLIFCLVNAALTVLIGTLIALLMRAVPAAIRILLQIAMLLAWSMPIVASMTVWRWLFDSGRGVINWVLVNIFGQSQYVNHSWLKDPISFWLVATVIIVWMSVPFVAFSVFAGLTQVSDEVLEAASLDGASAWQKFWLILMPMIRPVLTIVILLQIIWDLRVFAQIDILQKAGGTKSETNLLGNYIYEMGTASSNLGMASALSVLMLLLTVGVSWFYVRRLLKEDSKS